MFFKKPFMMCLHLALGSSLIFILFEIVVRRRKSILDKSELQPDPGVL